MKTIIILIFICILFYLYNKQLIPIQEKFATATIPPSLNKQISDYVIDTYSADVDAFRTMANISMLFRTSDNNLYIPGNIAIAGKFNLIPKKSIMTWHGETAPQGWTICDGANTTPDLKSFFVSGAETKTGKPVRFIIKK